MKKLPIIELISEAKTIRHRGSGWDRTIELPTRGKFVEESHYATTEDHFPDQELFPRSQTEKIENHLHKSLLIYQQYDPTASQDSLYKKSWNKVWTRSEGGGKAGQGSVGDLKPTKEEELWLMTMMWDRGEKPKVGSKFLLSAHDRHVVVIAGYETGPRDQAFLGGVTCEVHAWLQTTNSSQIEISYLRDQTVPIGPVSLQKTPIQSYKVLADQLNVRESPTLNSDILGVLKKDTLVSAGEQKSDGLRTWMKVSRSNFQGWVSMKYLGRVENLRLTVSATALNVRDKPSVEGLILGVLTQDEVVEAIDYQPQNGWWKVQKLDATLKGFASSKYLTPLNIKPSPLDFTQQPPEDYNPTQAISTIDFFSRPKLPASVKVLAQIELSLEQSQQYFVKGLKEICKTANDPSSRESKFEQAIQEGRVVDPPCATCHSQIMEYAARLANLPEVANLWKNPANFYPTHNNEALMKSLGFNYFLYKDYVAPVGSIGVWTRYTFKTSYGDVHGHTGHIFMIFQDGGVNGANVLVGDNTRKSHETHGHLYRPSSGGRCVGFWLPKGIYPAHRSS